MNQNNEILRNHFLRILKKGREGIKMKNAVIYARVACVSQDDNCNSINLQKQLCKDYCKKENLKVERIFSDNRASGLDIKRKGLVKLFKYLKKNKGDISYLVVRNFDRLTRSMVDASFLIKELESLGIKLKSIDGSSNDYSLSRLGLMFLKD